MRLNPTGHPLHTRLQTIDVRLGPDRRVIAAGTHLDLRKRGFVPVGADLQNAGVIHQMGIRAEIDPGQRRVVRAESTMPVVAFEPSGLTNGETCGDLAGELPALAGAPLGAVGEDRPGFAKIAGTAMGGIRGCSHVLNLCQLLGSAVTTALDVASAAGDDWSIGEPRRLYHRNLVFDGSEPKEGTIDLAVQLGDIHFAAAPPLCNPMDRFAEQQEVRLFARVDMARMSLTTLEVAERSRDRAQMAVPVSGDAGGGWVRRDAAVADLCGVPFLGGFAAEVLRKFAEPQRDRPLMDALLMLAPAFIQVCACFSETWPQRAMVADTYVGVGAMPDSCYMWRRDGALHRRKKPTDPNAAP